MFSYKASEMVTYLIDILVEKLIVMKLYKFELLFFDGTVITGKFCVGVPLNIQSIYLSICHVFFGYYCLPVLFFPSALFSKCCFFQVLHYYMYMISLTCSSVFGYVLICFLNVYFI